MATNADIEYDRMITELAARGVTEKMINNRVKAAGVNTTGRNWRKSYLPTMHTMFDEVTVEERREAARKARQATCRHYECDNRGICYRCGAYSIDADAMA